MTLVFIFIICAASFRLSLSFAMRLSIALDSAKGILYLHTEVRRVIFHRDIKPSNILLDSQFTAKVSDFGISKFAPVPDGGAITNSHSINVKGTYVSIIKLYLLNFKIFIIYQSFFSSKVFDIVGFLSFVHGFFFFLKGEEIGERRVMSEREDLSVCFM